MVAARNRGIRESRGVMIAPLDADDLWFEDKLRKQVDLLESSEPQVSLVYCWSVHMDGDDRLTGHWCSAAATDQVLVPLVLRNLLGNASTPLIRRSFLDKVGLYDESLRSEAAEATADWDLYLRLASISEFRVVPEFLMGYRLQAGNMSSDLEAIYRAYKVVMQRTRHRHADLPEELFRWSEAEFEFYLALLGAHYTGEWNAGFGWFKRALRTDPSLALQPRFYQRGLEMLLERLGMSRRRHSPRIGPSCRQADLRPMYRTIARKKKLSLDPFARRVSRYS